MGKVNLYSWNVNGIRSVMKKGFLDWLNTAQPDVLGLQETKISDDMLTAELRNIPGYHTYWSHHNTKKGYSGVAILTKEKPISVTEGMGVPEFDTEGRTLVAKYKDFIIYNIYFPNGQMNDDRLAYKLQFYDALIKQLNALKEQGKKLIICGDYNTAHHEIDLARPKENAKTSGFLPIERAWMDRLVMEGYVDTFRHLNPDKAQEYSWWNTRTMARERNVGWRIDYFFVSENLVPLIHDARIHQTITGSDHCPVSLELNL